jgi:hypothetical protein
VSSENVFFARVPKYVGRYPVVRTAFLAGGQQGARILVTLLFYDAAFLTGTGCAPGFFDVSVAALPQDTGRGAFGKNVASWAPGGPLRFRILLVDGDFRQLARFLWAF